MTARSATVIYAAASIPAIVGTFMLEGAAIDAVNALTPRPFLGPWTAWLVDTVPAVTLGFIVYGTLAVWVAPEPTRERWFRSHFIRAAALYVVFGLTGLDLVMGWRDSHYWEVGQVVLWPFMMVSGGIAADAVVAVVRQRRLKRNDRPGQ